MTTATQVIVRHGSKSECARRAYRLTPADLEPAALKILQMKGCVACPTCGEWMGWAEPVIGKMDAGRECNSRCMGATHGGVCECRCAGENHGGAWS